MKAKFFLLVIAIAFTGYSMVQAQSTSSQLDGKKFRIELSKTGSTEVPIVQTLVFSNSMMQTPDFNSLGFKESKAYVKPTEDYFTWTSTINSEKEGVMGWQGSVKGDKIEGTCTWRRAGAQPVQYTFTGTAVKTSAK